MENSQGIAKRILFYHFLQYEQNVFCITITDLRSPAKLLNWSIEGDILYPATFGHSMKLRTHLLYELTRYVVE